ncbi:hypothetical protein BH10BDE1_BH10BDE1_03570 [soil metagenome]
MLRALLLLALVASPALANAKHGDRRPTPKAGWTCYAQGTRSFGGPVGDIWETQTAYGRTQMDAAQNAISRCFSSGLNRCMVQSCWQR